MHNWLAGHGLLLQGVEMSSVGRRARAKSPGSSRKGLRETQGMSGRLGDNLEHSVDAVWGPVTLDQSTQLDISSRQSSRQRRVS